MTFPRKGVSRQRAARVTFALVNLLMMVVSGNRCLHDRIAGARVVRDEPAPIANA